MAAGDVVFSPGAFQGGETVTVFAKDITPGMPDVTTGKTGVVAANGGLTVAAVPLTTTQHGTTQPTIAIGVGGTSGRRISALPAQS